MTQGFYPLLFIIALDQLILISLLKSTESSYQVMIVINCNHIIDGFSLFELLSALDSGGVGVEYLEISLILSKKQFMPHFQYFEYNRLSVNVFDRYEWFNIESGYLKYMQLIHSTQIEAVVINNAWGAPTTKRISCDRRRDVTKWENIQILIWFCVQSVICQIYKSNSRR